MQGTAELDHGLAAGSLTRVAGCDLDNVRKYYNGEAGCEAAQRCKVLRCLCHERAEGRQAAPKAQWDVLVICEGGAV